MELAIGKSTEGSERAAAAEAVRAALRTSRGTFAMVFATVQYDPVALANAVTEALGDIPWAGCFTAGVIAGGELLERGIVVGLLSGKGIRVAVGAAGPLERDAAPAGRAAAEQAISALPPLSNQFNRTLIVLPNSESSQAVAAVRGAAQQGGTGVYWAGGGTGANYGIPRTAQFAFGEAFRDHVVVVAIDSPNRVGVGVRHGWQPYGPASMVTRIDGPLLQELDFMPAFDVYRGTAAKLGDTVSRAEFTHFATMHPLGIPQAFGGHLIRDPLEVNDEGAIQCVGEVPDGSIVRMMIGTPEGLLEAAEAAAREAVEAVNRQPRAVFLFDCFSRYVAFGNSLAKELAVIRGTVGESVPLMGCLTFGEVATFDGSVPQFHNKTAVVLGFC